MPPTTPKEPIPMQIQRPRPLEPLHSMLDLDVPVAGKSLLPVQNNPKRKMTTQAAMAKKAKEKEQEIPQEPIFVKANPLPSTKNNPFPNIGNTKDNLWTEARPVPPPNFVDNNENVDLEAAQGQNPAQDGEWNSEYTNDVTPENRITPQSILGGIKKITQKISNELNNFNSQTEVADFQRKLSHANSDLQVLIRSSYKLDKLVLEKVRSIIQEHLSHIDSEIQSRYDFLGQEQSAQQIQAPQEPQEQHQQHQQHLDHGVDTQEEDEISMNISALLPGQWFALYHGRILCFSSDKDSLWEQLNHFVLNDNVSIENIKVFKCVNVDFGILIGE
jgi:hypothetical protein